MSDINFFQEETDFELSNATNTAEWIESVIKQEGAELSELNFIFCSDEYLHKMNMEYLNHDTYTDIITFDNSDEEGKIEGDVFISTDRVADNATKEQTSLDEEVHRVMVHGVLHLLGHGDKTDEEKQAMRKKEEACLSLRK